VLTDAEGDPDGEALPGDAEDEGDAEGEPDALELPLVVPVAVCDAGDALAEGDPDGVFEEEELRNEGDALDEPEGVPDPLPDKKEVEGVELGDDVALPELERNEAVGEDEADGVAVLEGDTDEDGEPAEADALGLPAVTLALPVALIEKKVADGLPEGLDVADDVRVAAVADGEPLGVGDADEERVGGKKGAPAIMTVSTMMPLAVLHVPDVHVEP